MLLCEIGAIRLPAGLYNQRVTRLAETRHVGGPPLDMPIRPTVRFSMHTLLAAGSLSVLCGCDQAAAPNESIGERASDRHEIAATSWTNFRGSTALTGVAPQRMPPNPTLAWTFEAEGAIVSSPVVEDGRVYFGSDDGRLYCVTLDSGDLIWSYPTEFLIEAPPLIHDGLVYVGSHDFFMYALDAVTGELRWKFETYEKIVGGANVVRSPDNQTDWIIIGSHDAFVYALDAKTGEMQWRFETNDRVNATPAVVDGQIVFGGCDTILYVLNAAGTATSSVSLGDGCHIVSSIAIDDGVAYVGHHANEFLAIEIDTGEIIWSYTNPRFGFYSPPAVTDSRVVFGGRDKRLHCVDRETGEALWTFPTRRKVDSAPVVCGDQVVFGSGDGRLYIVRLEDGSEVWSYDVGKSIYSSPAVVNGMILVGANDGRMYAFTEAERSSSGGSK